jgi:PPM family protein phosphatase
MTRFIYGAATSIGHVRKVNEDSLLVNPPLFVVADGMGGHGAGDLASSLAVEAVSSAARLRPLTEDGVLTALDGANRAIVTYEGARGMGTTITGLALVDTPGGDRLMVFNIGDSRVYRLSGGDLVQVTIDHSEVQELVEAGVITRDEARIHPRRNIVTRALGTIPPCRPDCWLLPAMGGDRYMACSDGLYSEVADEKITALLSSGDPQVAAEALVAAAEAAGGHDNISVIVIDVVGFGDLGDYSEADVPTVPWRDVRNGLA